MKKSLFTFALVLTFFGAGAHAFAYELPGPVAVKDVPMTLGTDEVDFTKASTLTAEITVDTLRSGNIAYFTAGDVAGGKAGFGFVVIDNMIHIVTTNGGFARRMPFTFIYPGQVTKLVAKYTPNDGIRIDSESTSSVFKMYARGIVADNLPSVRFSPAFAAVAKGTTATVGSWSYAQ